MQQSATGIVIPGEEILKRQAISLAAITTDILDSVVFPLQAIRYNNALPVIQLPARLGGRWEATTTRSVDFLVTVNSYGLDKEPAEHRQTRRYLDSVVGWGRMRVPIPGKGSSEWIQVLQVQHSDIVLDSFFLSGAPAPAALLGAIGVTQGQITTYPSTYFYRAGAFRPLAEAIHSGPTHGSGLLSFFMHAQNLPVPVSVQSASASGSFRMYPNPAKGGAIRIELPDNSKAGWRYVLTGISGQVIASGELPLDGNRRSAQVQLPATVSSGIYYMSLSQDGSVIGTLPLTVD